MNRPLAPVELVPASSTRAARWMRRLFDRGAPRARMVAPPEARLGERLEVEWALDCPEGDLADVRVALVGTEISRRHISARTGIAVVAETSDFVVLELARVAPAAGVRVATGRASVAVPARTVPSLAGRYNEIAWALVVEATFREATSREATSREATFREATFRAAPALRESFPLRVLPGGA